MWTAVLKFLGIGLPALIDKIVELKAKQLDAKTEQQRIEMQEKIDVLEQRKQIIINSQNQKLGEWVRLLWALPFIVYIWKLLLWDKVLGWGATDALSPTLEYILWTVLGGYFMLGITDKIRK